MLGRERWSWLWLSGGLLGLSIVAPIQAQPADVRVPLASARSQLEGAAPLLSAAAAGELLGAELALAVTRTELEAALDHLRRVESETRQVRRHLAREVGRARAAEDRARAAELARLNVDLSRLERDVRAAAAVSDLAALHGALEPARRRVAALRSGLVSLEPGITLRALGLAVWKVVATDEPRRALVVGELAPSLLRALEAVDPAVVGELAERWRAAVQGTLTGQLPADGEAWAELAAVAAEVATLR